MATKFLTFFDTFTTDNLGQIFLTGVIDVQEYGKVHLEIFQWPTIQADMTVSCVMGKISGETLAQEIEQFPLGANPIIHTFEVIAPEFTVNLTGGTPATEVPIQAWVFLN
jgi:hypothetical protein